MKSKNNTLELEFIALMAFLTANVSLTINTVLPALTDIGKSFVDVKSTDLQLIITMVFLGLGVGQLIFGPISDSLGRKPAIYIGMVVFFIASFICVFATSIEMMLIGRVLQGIGLSAPSAISTSIIRDVYSGNQMAKIMSFVATIFILVPMITPILGQKIVDLFNWQTIFYFQIFFASIILLWLAIRQKETLIEKYRVKLTKRLFINGIQEFSKHRVSIVYTVVLGLMTGSFMAYLSVTKQIFQDQYGLIEEFVYIFAALATSIGLASLLNGSLVVKYGMKKLANGAIYLFSFSALVYASLFYFYTENPSLPILLFFLSLQLLSIGFIFGNIKSLAMQPIGHIAGIGAAINGFTSTIIAVPIAILIGKFVDTTALPLFIGFLTSGSISILLIHYFCKKNSRNIEQKNIKTEHATR